MAKRELRQVHSSGKLRIGDDWNAITIIALSQSNPLKAVAEFVENSIDAKARNVTIIRGKERGEPFLRIIDDGDGVPKDNDGVPNFKYVATHVCDSIKRRLSRDDRDRIQGEFGIGLLSFWTVGQHLVLSCVGADGRVYEMQMSKGEPGYRVTQRKGLLVESGTRLTIKPLLPGIRSLSGEKLQWYLASELRDRIRNTGVKIQIVDRQARTQLPVQPRQFSGRLLHDLPAIITPDGEVYAEIYLTSHEAGNAIGLYRAGTRVVSDLGTLDEFRRSPWTSGYFQGILDVPFLNLTPGTRLGVIQDATYAILCDAIQPLEEALEQILAGQRKAEEEEANQHTLRSIQKAFREALLTLPEEEYEWFDLRGRGRSAPHRHGSPDSAADTLVIEKSATQESETGSSESESEESPLEQKEFFDHAGPLHSLRISPATCVVPVGQTKGLRAIPRDRRQRRVDADLTYQWEVVEGQGNLEPLDAEMTTFQATAEPGLVKIRLTVTQDDVVCEAESLITVTDSLIEPKKDSASHRGLPTYTFENAPGKLWRSRYIRDQNVIVINKGHRDFVYSSRAKALQLRYICRLFVKELVLENFPGSQADQLLERMVELCLYTEENLR
ncbi:MAG: ATP-binding protein [Pirellulales bacterium]